MLDGLCQGGEGGIEEMRRKSTWGGDGRFWGGGVRVGGIWK